MDQKAVVERWSSSYGSAMNIEHMRTFLEIAACGNFNRAARPHACCGVNLSPPHHAWGTRVLLGGGAASCGTYLGRSRPGVLTRVVISPDKALDHLPNLRPRDPDIG